MATHNPFRRNLSPLREPEASTSAAVETRGPPPPIPPRPSSPSGKPGQERDVPESDSDASRSPSPAHHPPPGSPPLPSRPPAAEQPGLPPRPPRSEARHQPPPGSPPLPPPPPDNDLRELLRGESPPPYTPAPDVRQGETTVELGPRRPFQQAPQPARFVPPLSPPWQRSQPRAQPQWPPAAWTQYPGGSTGSLARTATGSTYRRTAVAPPPPPRAPTQHRTGGSFAAPPPAPPQPASDFARDFYAAGADDAGLLGGSSAQYAPPPSSQYAPPPGAPPQSPYAPPPGPPPGHEANGRPETPPRPANGASPQSDTPDDGRPTMKPVPGHPLMNNGRVLVYPQGYECPKCNNTGYKHLDPSNPCMKCWSKYAKPFAGPLTYAPWGAAGENGNNFQQPLPALPQSPAGTRFPPPPPHGTVARAASTSRAGPGAAAHATGIPLANGGFLPTAGYASPLHGASAAPTRVVSAPYNPYNRAPPPGATVVRPGDPRIGGQLCWRCSGRGTTTFFIFDETCNVCDGLGRTFP
ncbi:hypothetical protein PsYK624_093560 [Phanerochaete sordida]|uniref:Uncharacterized protein n=1 Tax=Phanerochaete sordida TaxID=48140 RepID=A0A9P3GEB3_9APHY|nr:hypothetical protein PsYK624_093560 [Phanerochaete sordida]